MTTKYTSFSQLNLFARCPWAWGLKYRAAYEKKDDTTPKMQLGGLIHDGLACHHLDPGAPIDWEDIRRESKPPPEIDLLEEAKHLVNLYTEYWQPDDGKLDVVAAEWPFALKIPTPAGVISTKTGKPYKGASSQRLLIGWIDLITRDERGKLWVWDHKTGKSFPSVIEMAQDFQLSTYAWALRKMGASVGGVVLNLIRTTGKTSKERFVRDKLPKLDHELDQWGETLYWRSQAMPPPRIPWNQLPKNTGRDCSWCSFYDLCVLHQNGQYEAVRDMIKNDYHKKKTGWMGWLEAYNRKLPKEWLAPQQVEKEKITADDLWGNY